MTSRTRDEAPAKAATLIEALPWLRRFHGKIVVIKFGGNAMTGPALRRVGARFGGRSDAEAVAAAEAQLARARLAIESNKKVRDTELAAAETEVAFRATDRVRACAYCT